MYTLLNYRKGVSKESKRKYCQATFLAQITERDKNAGMEGNMKVAELWLFEGNQFIDYLQADMVGKDFKVFKGLEDEVVHMEVLEKGGK